MQEPDTKRHDPEQAPQQWYSDGLRFTCTQCGNCCSGPKGFVWFNDDEARAIAEFLDIDETTFRNRYTRKLGRRWTLDERWNPDISGYDCIFLKREGGKALCGIYPVRPQQCRTWPFWPENLETPRDYVRAAARCPGMQAGLQGKGKLYPIEQIRVIRDSNPT